MADIKAPTNVAVWAARRLQVTGIGQLSSLEDAANIIDAETGVAELTLALALWIALADLNGAYAPEDISAWAYEEMAGKGMTPQDAARSAIAKLTGRTDQ